MRNQLSVPATVLALLALAACGTETKSGSDSGPGTGSRDGGKPAAADVPLTGVFWTVNTLTVDGKKTESPADAYFEVTTKGQAQGNFGCNQFGAKAVLAGDTLTVGSSHMTEVGCAQPIQSFEKALKEAFVGKLKAELVAKKLTLTNEKGDTIALTSEPPAPLVGTKWTVNSMMELDMVESLPAGTEKNAHLTFAKDGTVSGNLGCNDFNATVKISGTQLTFGPVSSTRKMCTGTAGQLEAHLMKAMAGKATYEVHQRGLFLYGPEGMGFSAAKSTA
ncbi:META domain-containing protein [Streptomyces albipurpureus]|uniref:META domain-containing protein n=1 Tax=Streptomyces albipurpureus TaxID=2897419 RepID=A0ABT0UR80_9ACTN|nr:META domain-containing protein [Streptomyces sp. CWNU-1]MCM2390944.1 META domain-containing protein [Streptomyces sp. CWNU-1]